MPNPKTVLITGAAKRIGKVIAKFLHAQGMRIIIHYRYSTEEAYALRNELNHIRPDSATALQADLLDLDSIKQLVEKTLQTWGYLDVLVNNASAFFQTPQGTVNEQQWASLMDANLKAPFFLSQLVTPWIKQRQGSIVNIGDIHAKKPMKNYSVYCMSKAGMSMMTYALAKELAPDIRVNAVAPGSIIWPENENELDAATRDNILSRIPLERSGQPTDIAQAVFFLIESPYITGQILAVDGGRLLNC